MNSTEMLATLKTRLDEGGVRSDSELYQALSNGQIEAVNTLIREGRYTKDYAESVKYTYSTTHPDPIPDKRPVLSARYAYSIGNYYESRVLSAPEVKNIQDNKFTSPSETDPVVYQEGGEIKVLPTPVADKSMLEYVRVKEITPITDSTEPILDERTHNAIIQWAYAEVLSKDESRASESEQEKAIFYNMLKAI